MALIYHIAFPTDWEEAKKTGEYRISTRGRSLPEEGFIHAAEARQVAGVASRFYEDAATEDLIVLLIEVEKIKVEIRHETPPGSSETFPHIYGALDVNAVVGTLPLGKDAEERARLWPA
ncbi:MAG TPA: DUF952 domain-containing protein [Actinocrinis sp.]|nr:DUF952 domain-containing protein [Actinocrinis sp.]